MSVPILEMALCLKRKKWEGGIKRICLDLGDLLCAGHSARCWWCINEQNRKAVLFKLNHGRDGLKI